MASDGELLQRALAQEAPYRFTKPGTSIFINGAPLTGKTTIAPLLAANLAGSTIQNGDIIRLAAQAIDQQLPESIRNPFLQLGSCDAYLAVGDGLYSPETLIEGYRAYSEATCRLLGHIVSRAEVQGANDIIFEGVQLMPDTVKPYLEGTNRLIVLTSNREMLGAKRDRRYGSGPSMLHDRYSDDRILLIQEEILRQANGLDSDIVLRLRDTGRYVEAVAKIIDFLHRTGTIEESYE